jgi:hypothetical protein
MVREEALAYWFSDTHDVFVADDDGSVIGTYFLRPNQMGGGSHVANCGYMTAPAAFGRGVARAMCMDSLKQAKGREFRSMQFTFVVSTNDRAVRLERRQTKNDDPFALVSLTTKTSWKHKGGL